MKKKWFYGYSHTNSILLLTIFSYKGIPTEKSHGEIFFAVNGAYPSKARAIAEAKYHRRSVNGAVVIMYGGKVLQE